jgi:glycine/D-amino acid oxidase-like deaminating enzyme
VAGGYHVRTPSGSVTARRVVLATSAHQHQLAGFRRRVLPVWSYALVSEPLTDRQLARIAWPGREGLVEAKTFLHCGRFTADNRIMWAGGSPRYFRRRDMRPARMRNDAVYRELRDSFRRYFPAWSDVRFGYAYGGCVDVTRDLVPHFGSRGPGLFHGYGYCGNGIAASHLGGKVLRDLVLGRHTEFSTSVLVGGPEPAFPPEPVAFCGARLTSRLIQRREARA